MVNTPTEVAGNVFMKVRQCPASGVKNTDKNVIKQGKWGPDFSKYVVWHRGTSQNPDGRYERVSVLVWQHAGFADITGMQDMDSFVQKLKTDNQLAKEFRAAYAEMVKIIEEGTMRFKAGASKNEVAMRLEKARKASVTVFSRSQLEVKTKYRGVERSVYEAKHPGRIQARGMRVVKAKADGVAKELVLVPLLGKGEYEVDSVDMAGVDMSEVQDDGEAIVSQQQLRRKFDNLSKQCVGGAIESKQNRELEEEAELSEAERVRVDSGDEALSDSSKSEAGDDDDLNFVRSSLLAGFDEPGSPRTSARGGADATPVRCTTRSTTSGSSVARHSGGPFFEASPASKVDGGSEAATPKKFAGKTAEDILEKHNLPTIKEALELACKALGAASLQSLEALSSERCVKVFNDFKKHIVHAHKATVALDIKVKKWSAVPASVSTLILHIREKTTVLHDATKYFTPNKRGNIPDKMKEVMEAMLNMGMDVPVLFRGMYAYEQILDYVRFGQVDEIVGALDLNTGVLKGCVMATEAQAFFVDVLATALQTIVSGSGEATTNGEDDLAKLKFIAQLAFAASLVPIMSSAASDLQTLHTALGGEGISIDDQTAAMASLDELKGQAGYSGVLKTAFVDKRWSGLMSLARQSVSVIFKNASEALCTKLQDALHQLVNTDTGTAAARQDFVAALLAALANMADPTNSKALPSTLSKVLAGLLVAVKAGASKWESLLQKACLSAAGAQKTEDQHAIEEHKTEMQELQASAVNLADKTIFDIDSVLADAGTAVGTSVVLSETVSAQVSELKQAGDVLSKLKVVTDSVFSMASALQKVVGADDTVKATVVQRIIVQLSEAKTIMMSAGKDFSPELSASWQELEASCDCKAAGENIYTAQVSAFKTALQAMVEHVVAQEVPLCAQASDAIAANVQSIVQMEQVTMQACAWSSSPRFDREGVLLGTKTIAKVCDGARLILSEDPGKNFKKDPELATAIGFFDPLDNAKPLLTWLLGEHLTGVFGAKVQQLRDILFPLHKACDESATTSLLQAMQDLTALLVKESPPVPHEHFKAHLNQKTVTTIKKLRQDVRTYSAMLDQHTVSALPGMKDADRTLDLAKYQVFRWGLVMFMYHKQSRESTEAGKEVRKNLQNLWGLHSVDEGFQKYFGEAGEQEIKAILAVDAAKPTAKPGKAAPAKGSKAKRAEATDRVEPAAKRGKK